MEGFEERYVGEPSSDEEIEVAELFDHNTIKPGGTLSACYDAEGDPWVFWWGMWQRAADVGNPDAIRGEKPTWASFV